MLPCVQRIFIFRLCSVTHNDAVGDDKGSSILSLLLPCEITYFRYIFPYLVGNNRKATLQVCKLLLDFGSLCSMLGQFYIFACLPSHSHCSLARRKWEHNEPASTRLRARLRESILWSTESYILSASSSSCSYVVVPAKRPYSFSGSWNCSGFTSGSSPRLACASLQWGLTRRHNFERHRRNLRYCFCGWTFSGRTNIRTRRKTRSTGNIVIQTVD